MPDKQYTILIYFSLEIAEKRMIQKWNPRVLYLILETDNKIMDFSGYECHEIVLVMIIFVSNTCIEM